MSTEAGNTPAAAPQTPTENQAAPQSGYTEISSLANYRARQAASSAPATAPQQAGIASPDTGATPATTTQVPQREPAIPRERFDEVNTQKNQAVQQAQALQAQVALYQQQLAQVQQAQAITGMTGAAPQFPQYGVPQPAQAAQPQAARPNVPDFNDPTVQKQWREKIANNPVTGLREFVTMMIQAEGAPLLQQFQQQILGQIQPIQQTFVQQQLQSYVQGRTQADPTFAQVQPAFQNLVSQAAQRGVQLTPQTLQAIEGLARGQAGLLTAPAHVPQAAPFTERPGGSADFGQPSQPTLSPLEMSIAQRFEMTPAEYAAFRQRNG